MPSPARCASSGRPRSRCSPAGTPACAEPAPCKSGAGQQVRHRRCAQCVGTLRRVVIVSSCHEPSYAAVRCVCMRFPARARRSLLTRARSPLTLSHSLSRAQGTAADSSAVIISYNNKRPRKGKSNRPTAYACSASADARRHYSTYESKVPTVREGNTTLTALSSERPHLQVS